MKHVTGADHSLMVRDLRIRELVKELEHSNSAQEQLDLELKDRFREIAHLTEVIRENDAENHALLKALSDKEPDLAHRFKTMYDRIGRQSKYIIELEKQRAGLLRELTSWIKTFPKESMPALYEATEASDASPTKMLQALRFEIETSTG